MTKYEQPRALRQMPDIALHGLSQHAATLDWVGMQGIHLPLRLSVDGEVTRVVGTGDVFVDLIDPAAKGIHMSRLYLALTEFAQRETLTPAALANLAQALVRSHDTLSSAARVQLQLPLLRQRSALSSDHTGFANYPLTICVEHRSGVTTLELGFVVTYSSTCPCSAALARQLICEQFRSDFAHDTVSRDAVLQWLSSEQGIVATPHSQRSFAQVRVKLAADTDALVFDALIDAVEDCLQTAVQTAVKREDEQAFALRNGRNLMFCEDAARRVAATLNTQAEVGDYWVRVEHQESLHPHNAVAVACKGLANGYGPSHQFEFGATH